MREYCFKCPSCDNKHVDSTIEPHLCATCNDFYVRDYKAEAIGFSISSLKEARQ